ncbi:DUF3899 domain-containing protein [Peribacillus sp. NPDC097225]|uniref:DUF3899 domain-containing protein n=1 Tax=unclassified Peribacillus TaxID=2675266 RepID=UPI0038048A38
MKKILIGTGFGIVLSILLSLIFHQALSLLNFINMTFYISGGLILLALVTFVVQRGFFDVVFYSFRRVFQIQNQHVGEEKEDIPKLSDIISLSSSFTLVVGLILFCIMLLSLAVYYL